ncbi:unnamed protein product [Eruca vesicaria subsp. sativa]|uniref:Protein kinase domain-containing protein n=1 Tax=Eruca vesicaria subsp. sativa TaxID=29727 RepID=A0ABC8JGV7_ERUVS|nr:unnamed protein product [Eruca vesicaria subsp. sativa]
MEFWRRKKEKEKARNWFLRNGSLFLEQHIADCNGISNPIRIFSFHQIKKATNNFDPKSCISDNRIPLLTWYKGSIEGRSYSIKKSRQLVGTEPYNDIVLSAQVSNNYRFLNDRGSVGRRAAPLLPWNVHNVLLDKNGTAKLSDLSEAVTLPEGKPWIEEPRLFGTMGYIDPIYGLTGIVTEYSDVYSFGILIMLVLLMGKPAYLAGLNSPLSPKMFLFDYVKYVQERGEAVEFGGDSNDMKPGQMKMFLELALRCCEEKNEDRPKMILVAKEIKLIEQALLEDGQT